MLAAAPSWTATITACAVLLSVALGALVSLLRDLGETATGEGDGRRRQPPLPLIIFAGVPVAIVCILRFAIVAHRDHRLEGNEAVVLSAGTGVIVLLIAIDLIRFGRRERAADVGASEGPD